MFMSLTDVDTAQDMCTAHVTHVDHAVHAVHAAHAVK